jgi:hypothetical protein
MNPTPSKDPYGAFWGIVSALAVFVLLLILCVSIWQPGGRSDPTRQLVAWAAGGIVLGVVMIGLYVPYKLDRQNVMQSSTSTPKRPPIVGVIAIVCAVSPWLGIAARLLAARTWTIACVGAVLWSTNCAGLWHLHRLPEIGGKRSLGVSVLVWTLTFVPLFTATAAATNWVLSRYSVLTVH